MDFHSFVTHFWSVLVYTGTKSPMALPFWAAVIWFFLLLLRRQILRLVFHHFGADDPALQRAIVARIDLPLQLLLVIVATAPFIDLIPGRPGSDIDKATTFLGFFLVVHVAIQCFYFLFVRWYLEGKKDAKIPGVIVAVALGLCYGTVFLVLLNWNYHLNVLPLLATSTVLTAVAALALQDTLRNIFAGLTVSLEQSFKQGDWVLFRQDAANTLVGEVIEIGWRSTKIRTLNNNYVIIPNSQFTTNELINYNSPTPVHARELRFPVSLAAKPDEVRSALEKAAMAVPGVLPKPAASAIVLEMQATQVIYQLRFWLDHFENRERISSDVIEAVWQKLAQMSVLPASSK